MASLRTLRICFTVVAVLQVVRPPLRAVTAAAFAERLPNSPHAAPGRAGVCSRSFFFS